jgi:hypothetical protein
MGPGHRSGRHADRGCRQDGRHRHPGLLLPSQDGAGRHVPHVPGGDRPPGDRPRHRPAGARTKTARPRSSLAPSWRPPAPPRFGRHGGVTQSEKAGGRRKDIIEFLLTSHPLDCPICDKGGECPLQNLTMGTARARAALSTMRKCTWPSIPAGRADRPRPRALHPVRRCVRFQDEIAGDPVIGFSSAAGARDRHLLRPRALTRISRATPPISARSAR